ncbi:DUF2171 domain-containing protein [Falsiroseomonas sp.]|uniref:DUF2171 domain-containing protein n=1 Tax=Falsiroseomonas sp. TaxID=2870721 RepID=UPI003F6F250B
MSEFSSQIEEHMEVVGADGGHVGTVDHLDGDRIKLTRKDDPDGTRQHHHFLPLSLVAAVAEGRVRLNLPAEVARNRAVAAGHD